METLDIVTIGSIAGELQVPTTAIRRAADALGISPKLRINRIDHFDSSDVELIANLIRRETKKPYR